MDDQEAVRRQREVGFERRVERTLGAMMLQTLKDQSTIDDLRADVVGLRQQLADLLKRQADTEGPTEGAAS